MLSIHIFEFITNPIYAALSVVSLVTAFIFFFHAKKTKNPSFIYAHLFFLFSPFILFAATIPCNMGLVSGLFNYCGASIAKIVIYAIPLGFLFMLALGYMMMPNMLISLYCAKPFSKKLLAKQMKSLLAKQKVHLINKAEPSAFSCRNHIFVSEGMCDILSKKELEAVLLHELGHVKRKAPLFKFSAKLSKLFSPLAMFSTFQNLLDSNEREADVFAAKIQGTTKHLNSAKRKIEEYSSKLL